MLTYCILKKNNTNDIEITETGFSVLAFIFGPLWGFFKKLWLFSFIGIIFLFGFKFLFQTVGSNYLILIVSICSSIFWGFFARDLYIQSLILQKFKPIKHIVASSRENALIKHLSEENL